MNSNIKISSEVEVIDNNAFENCKKLKKVEFGIPSNLKRLGGYSFAGCQSIEKIEISSNVLFINDASFLECSNLKKIKISRNFEKDIERIFGKIDKSIIEWID